MASNFAKLPAEAMVRWGCLLKWSDLEASQSLARPFSNYPTQFARLSVCRLPSLGPTLPGRPSLSDVLL